MRLRIIVGALLFMAIAAIGTRIAAEASLKWAIVNLNQPTMIAGTLVVGPVMFVHDDAKMARGEACTSVHRFWPTGAAEQLVAFHCKPRSGHAPAKFTASVKDDASGPRMLTAYQFAGDTEAHGVPAQDKPAAHEMNHMKGMHCADGCKDCTACKDCADCKDCNSGKECKNCKK